MQKNSESDQVQHAIRQLDTVREAWLSRVDVVGCDVGYNYEKGQRTDEIVIRAHVHRQPDSPQDEPFPLKIGEFRVIIIEANYGLEDSAGPETL